eukprot:gnl/TRDRNA2_/TRDRNA2_171778_c0_seq1.p1 gnl/TRDRNA2_/TRDRNA2_171778_c0~~gnl/TRDRNA2_/TRDRNA2_171778_c0_seq1.p1  ORF type:complete len:183 (+),score=22.22 gnl/TRDRNA2_/TRDRNA2_171778_c0_seq1:450-998(+)
MHVDSFVLDWNACMELEFKPRLVADVVIAADCHYYSKALHPLVASIMHHLKSNGTFILASKEGRISLNESRMLLQAKGFEEVRKIDFEGDHVIQLYRGPYRSRREQEAPESALNRRPRSLPTHRFPETKLFAVNADDHVEDCVYASLALVSSVLLLLGLIKFDSLWRLKKAFFTPMACSSRL